MDLLALDSPAPDFTLASSPEETLTLSGLRGKKAVLAFYPADWSPVCGDQLSIYNRILPLFERYDALLLGISVDGKWCHQAWKRERKLNFPLLADFEPKGEVARRYGVYRTEDGTSERALYVIDGAGIIRWRFLSKIDVNPGAEGLLDVLESLQAKEVSA
jgi:peroxiredoxin